MKMRALNKLSAAQVKTRGAGKYSDGGGLWLNKRHDGGAQWVLRVTVHGRRREMGLGSLQYVSLKEARAEAEKWRAVVRQGKDPIKERERLRREASKEDHSLALIAEEAFEARKAELGGGCEQAIEWGAGRAMVASRKNPTRLDANWHKESCRRRSSPEVRDYGSR